MAQSPKDPQKPPLEELRRMALLWPALYAAHAILIVAGAPIAFTAHPWDMLNVLIPIAGYGLISGLAQHVYSRIALARLRKLSQTGPTGAGKPGERSRP